VWLIDCSIWGLGIYKPLRGVLESNFIVFYLLDGTYGVAGLEERLHCSMREMSIRFTCKVVRLEKGVEYKYLAFIVVPRNMILCIFDVLEILSEVLYVV
jgi:hypothetical protein